MNTEFGNESNQVYRFYSRVQQYQIENSIAKPTEFEVEEPCLVIYSKKLGLLTISIMDNVRRPAFIQNQTLLMLTLNSVESLFSIFSISRILPNLAEFLKITLLFSIIKPYLTLSNVLILFYSEYYYCELYFFLS